MAQLSNAVVQPASMLAQPSSMLAQLRIWIGYGLDLVFERRPETSSTAKFSQAADHPEPRAKLFEPRAKTCSNQGRKPSALGSEGFALGWRLSPLVGSFRTKGEATNR